MIVDLLFSTAIACWKLVFAIFTAAFVYECAKRIMKKEEDDD